jgi:RNA polymerase sigma-70 factor (ECF subfamily)
MDHHHTETEFLSLVRQHESILHKICFVYTRNRTEKEDLMQEIILQLWKSFPAFSGRSAFSTWMYRVALNTAISQTKKRTPTVELMDTKEPATETESMMELSEDIQILYRAISGLKMVEKAIILLWLEEKSYEEIAATTGITVKNVSVQLVRIRKKLSGIIAKLQK